MTPVLIGILLLDFAAHQPRPLGPLVLPLALAVIALGMWEGWRR